MNPGDLLNNALLNYARLDAVSKIAVVAQHGLVGWIRSVGADGEPEFSADLPSLAVAVRMSGGKVRLAVAHSGVVVNALEGDDFELDVMLRSIYANAVDSAT